MSKVSTVKRWLTFSTKNRPWTVISTDKNDIRLKETTKYFSFPFRAKLPSDKPIQGIPFDKWCDDETDKSLELISLILIQKLKLKICFLKDLRNALYGIGQHRNAEDWVLIILQKKFDAIKDDSLKQCLSTELLDKIGFESDSAEIILSRSSLLLPNHDDPMDSVKRFVVDELKYSTSVTPDECKEVDMKNPGQTFSIDAISVDCICPGLKVPILKDIKLAIQSIRSRIDALQQEYHNDKFLFHGTDVLSAHDISSGGISLSMGSKKRDFSNGSGFYLTDDFERATYCAFNITQKPTVLIFCIPKSCLDNAKKLNLSEESKESQWKAIVNANLSGLLDWKMRESLEVYDFIEGPAVSSVCPTYNSRAGSRNVERVPEPNSYQICVINEDFADKISKCLKRVVTYNLIAPRPWTGF